MQGYKATLTLDTVLFEASTRKKSESRQSGDSRRLEPLSRELETRSGCVAAELESRGRNSWNSWVVGHTVSIQRKLRASAQIKGRWKAREREGVGGGDEGGGGGRKEKAGRSREGGRVESRSGTRSRSVGKARAATNAACRHLPHVQRPLGCESANDDQPLVAPLSHQQQRWPLPKKTRETDRNEPALRTRISPFRRNRRATLFYFLLLLLARCTSKMAASRSSPPERIGWEGGGNEGTEQDGWSTDGRWVSAVPGVRSRPGELFRWRKAHQRREKEDQWLRSENQPAWSASRDCRPAGRDGGRDEGRDGGGRVFRRIQVAPAQQAQPAGFQHVPGVVGKPGGGCWSPGNHERSTECAKPPFTLPCPRRLSLSPSLSLSLTYPLLLPLFPSPGGWATTHPSDGNDALATGISMLSPK